MIGDEADRIGRLSSGARQASVHRLQADVLERLAAKKACEEGAGLLIATNH